MNYEELGRDMLRYGEILVASEYDTEHGCFTVRAIKYNGCLYWHEMHNGEIFLITQLQ